MERKLITDEILIGKWEEVTELPTSDITNDDSDRSHLNGLLVYGYEMKFGRINENQEKYDPACFDEFIHKYFVANKLNIPVDVMHGRTFDDLVGRVIYCETNTTGFYFVCYIPRCVPRYEHIKSLLHEGIIQGFSKCGWATEWEDKYNNDGSLAYIYITQMQLLSVSLVATPANGLGFEKKKELRNETRFVARRDGDDSCNNDDQLKDFFV